MKGKISLLFLLPLLITASCSEDIEELIDPRKQFLGIWLVSESCIRLSYEVEIRAAADDLTKVLVYNFALTGDEYPPAYGFVSGKTITIPEQTIGDNWQVQGTGTLQPNGKIYWVYTLEIAGDLSNCQAEYSKP